MTPIHYLHRTISDVIKEADKFYPVITLTGPRQSGKSTLFRHLFAGVPYFSLEDPDIRQNAIEDPRGFLSEFTTGVILDEVQNVPELLSYIQGIVDRGEGHKFYLTGSSNFSLLQSITQSLAGRTAVFELLPLSLTEIASLDKGNTVPEFLYTGFYPSIWGTGMRPDMFYPHYVRTYLERDVRNLLKVSNLNAFHKFLQLCAARIGSLFNTSEVSNELGVSVNTVKSWLSILQASYIIYLLPPYFTNTKKRLTKASKIYFTDTGLAAFLLEIDSPDIMRRDKMYGHLFENMVVMEFLKKRLNTGKTGSLYFFRDSNGNEVDLLEKTGNKFNCYEIKSSETFHPEFMKGLKRFSAYFPDDVESLNVIYTGQILPSIDGIHIDNYLRTFQKKE